MSTAILKLGPTDHGLPLTYDDYQEAEYAGGYRYELISGRLYVSPGPSPPHDIVQGWLYRRLWKHIEQHPGAINHFSMGAEVWIRRGKRPTLPIPDITGFRDFSLERAKELHWYDLEPALAIEIMGRNSVKKDLTRNVKLYRRIATIREYWVVDIRENYLRPSMIVFRRSRLGWSRKTVDPGEAYTTRLLPELELILDPRA